MGRYAEADKAYGEVPKKSFVWTDILFEQAWNAYARKDYNRALGKLVTYRSPALNFVFNPETDVLRAQSYFSLCYYDDVNKTVNEFNDKYTKVGQQLKGFLAGEKDFTTLFNTAKHALRARLHTTDALSRALNRFVRGPYFARLVLQEKRIHQEAQRTKNLAIQSQMGSHAFTQYIEKVLNWRIRSVTVVAGKLPAFFLFVRFVGNSKLVGCIRK
jgi:hypothetical protein